MPTDPVKSKENVLAELSICPLSGHRMSSVMAIEGEAFSLDRYPVELMREHLQENPAGFLVAEVKGEMAGYIIGSVEGKTARIESMAVSQRWRRNGIGRAMLDHVLQQFRESGIGEVELQVRVDNTPAISLYDAVGFELERPLPDYYEPGAPANLMIKRLQTLAK